MQTPQKKVRFVFALFAMRNCGCVKAAKTVRISLTSRIPIVSMGKTRITNRNGISACRSTSPGRHVKCVLSMMKLAKFTLQMSFSKRQIQCLNSNIALFLRMSSRAELFSISRMGVGSCGSSTRVPNLKIAPLDGSVMTRISAGSESRSISGCAGPGSFSLMARILNKRTTSIVSAYTQEPREMCFIVLLGSTTSITGLVLHLNLSKWGRTSMSSSFSVMTRIGLPKTRK